MNDLFADNMLTRAEMYARLSNDPNLAKNFLMAGNILLEAISAGGKILIFGNGGSAAEAQHFAAELVCMFNKKRQALPVIALTTDSSILTAQSNDYGFDSVFSRQIDALCKPEDAVIGLTTSDAYDNGHSRNILDAFIAARKKRARTIGLFSIKTRNLVNFVDLALIVPAENTALIQEAHLALIHMICEKVEETIIRKNKKKKIVVAVSGGWDPIHIGHVRLFNEAKKLGDELIVILNNDNWLMKKKGFVFMPEKERKEIIEAFKAVDRVFISRHRSNPSDMSVSKELELLRPDIFANGGDRVNDDVSEARICGKINCATVFNVGEGGKVQSSSRLLSRHIKK